MNIPYGYCHCECGKQTKISNTTASVKGWIKGEPRKYLQGHNLSHWFTFDDIEARFWAKVDKRGDDECWPWKASCNKNGYGLALKIKGLGRKAHRHAWFYINGPIPVGLNILHKCDNPPCCNPNHLFTGTQLDNMEDCKSKGRHKYILPPNGILHHSAKLNEDDVKEILLNPLIPIKYFSKKFNVSLQNIYRIRKRLIWKHINL